MLITSYYSTIGDEATYRVGLLLSRYALSVKELAGALGLSQPHVSHKLAKLRKHDYVSRYRDGRRVIYRFKEPWRSILLHGDINWRKLNPEFTAIWNQDLNRLTIMLDDVLDERAIHPVISGAPGVRPPSQD